jgi:hypothetical protein
MLLVTAQRYHASKSDAFLNAQNGLLMDWDILNVTPLSPSRITYRYHNNIVTDLYLRIRWIRINWIALFPIRLDTGFISSGVQYNSWDLCRKFFNGPNQWMDANPLNLNLCCRTDTGYQLDPFVLNTKSIITSLKPSGFSLVAANSLR